MEQNRCFDEKSWVKGDDLEMEEYTILQIDNPKHELQKQKNYAHSYSSQQMEALAALCDTLLPSINIPKHADNNDPLLELHHTSASMAGVPLQAAMMLTTKTEHPKQTLVHLTLWLLSTAIGTLILCGRASLSNQFPYVQKFSRVSAEKREAIMVSWSMSYFFLLRMFFRALKFVVSLAFFTQASPLISHNFSRIFIYIY
ncbi:hypothetical protein OSB04_010852 [Centaurea solstitialis]|uniref:Uncharacterized protein n=1 Tax=Centaurea solstitialis TaxID=347529 RepID=A0AA38TT36_9ASTR|nr:hypothetical protein OSB04_010852 [Centaurea solstitialis]